VAEFLEEKANRIEAETDREDFVDNFDKYASKEDKKKALAMYLNKRKELHSTQIKIECLQNSNF
jgi:hypothetical protein